jgi:hypothetical protein
MLRARLFELCHIETFLNLDMTFLDRLKNENLNDIFFIIVRVIRNEKS